MVDTTLLYGELGNKMGYLEMEMPNESVVLKGSRITDTTPQQILPL